MVTGVANFGVFVQLRRFLIDGLVRLEDLGDDWWDVDAQRGQVRGERTGRTHRIGDLMRVRVAGVDEARRQLNLVPARAPTQPARPKEHAKGLQPAAPPSGQARPARAKRQVHPSHRRGHKRHR